MAIPWVLPVRSNSESPSLFSPLRGAKSPFRKIGGKGFLLLACLGGLALQVVGAIGFALEYFFSVFIPFDAEDIVSKFADCGGAGGLL